MAFRAKEVIKKCGGYKDNRKRFQSFADNLEFELAVVTHKGTGKYSQEDVVVPWCTLPEFPGQEVSENGYMLAAQQLELIAGWWPCVCVREAGAMHMTLVGYFGGNVIVISVCQLMWDTPSAWEVRVIPHSRM